jgi:hypothetical protein
MVLAPLCEVVIGVVIEDEERVVDEEEEVGGVVDN